MPAAAQSPKEQPEETTLELARRAFQAAAAADKAASGDSRTPEAVRAFTAQAVEATRKVLLSVEGSPMNKRERQSFAEFTTMLGEEVKEAAEEHIEEARKNAERTLRKAKSLIEDHFAIDEAFRMLGPLAQDSNLARDVHDWFNLVALLPVIFFNVINWRLAPVSIGGLVTGELAAMWHGDAFLAFWWLTLAYFVTDLAWMLVLPNCVRSPSLIIKHHVVTVFYIFIPYLRPEYGWIMGSCMIVELNTWFLIARRSWNKNGDKPFNAGVPLSKSFRLLFVSTCFYLTWFLIRLVVYPLVLLVILWENWRDWQNGTMNVIVFAPIMQCVFVYLNVKWTIDLFRSKMKSSKHKGPSKGL